MNADATDDPIEGACRRLFDLHASGFVRPKPRPARQARARQPRSMAVVARPPRATASII